MKETQVPDVSWEFVFVNRTNVTLAVVGDGADDADDSGLDERDLASGLDDRAPHDSLARGPHFTTREINTECLENEEDEYRVALQAPARARQRARPRTTAEKKQKK